MIVIGVCRGEVRQADGVVQAPARTPHDADDIVTDGQLHHPRADGLDDAEALVAQHEEARPGGRPAVLSCVDLLVRPVEADAEYLDHDPPAVGCLVDRGLGDVAQRGAVRDAGGHGYGFHAHPPRVGVAGMGRVVVRPAMRSATRPVQPVWWEAPRPMPVSPWKYSWNGIRPCQAGSVWNRS